MEKIRYRPTPNDYERYVSLNKYLLKRFRNAFLRADQQRAYRWLCLINKNDECFRITFSCQKENNIKEFYNKKIE